MVSMLKWWFPFLNSKILSTFLSSFTKMEVGQDPHIDENWEVPVAFPCLADFENMQLCFTN